MTNHFVLIFALSYQKRVTTLLLLFYHSNIAFDRLRNFRFALITFSLSISDHLVWFDWFCVLNIKFIMHLPRHHLKIAFCK